MRGDRFAAIGMARHDHGQQRRKKSRKRAVRLKQYLFFAGMRRGRHDHRTAARHRHQPLQFGEIGRRCRNIQFQIARDDDVAAAQRRKTLRVDPRLRQADVEPAEQRRDRAAHPAPARKRAMRHPAVDQHHRQTPRRARQDQIRPQIGFDEQRQRRPPVIEKARDIARRIVRHILMDDVGGKPLGDDRRRRHRARGQRGCGYSARATSRSAPRRPALRRRSRRESRPAVRAAGYPGSCRGARRRARDPPCPVSAAA